MSSKKNTLEKDIRTVTDAYLKQIPPHEQELWPQWVKSVAPYILADKSFEQHPSATVYMRLLAEGIQLGYYSIDELKGHFYSNEPTDVRFAPNVLATLWGRTFPFYLRKIASEQQAQALTDAWNIGEALRSEPPWLSMFLLHRLAEVYENYDGTQLAIPFRTHVEKALHEVLSPQRQSDFHGPYAVSIADSSLFEASFLPGEIHAAAPLVFCVHDRLRADTHAALLVSPDAEHVWLGLAPCLGRDIAIGMRPQIENRGSHATVQGETVVLPHFTESVGQAFLSSGYIAFSAVDSQQIWIAQSL